jgi:hypothetical protein
LARRRYEAIKAQNALSDSSKEALDAEAQAYIALQGAQQQTAQVQRKLAMEAERIRNRGKRQTKTSGGGSGATPKGKCKKHRKRNLMIG